MDDITGQSSGSAQKNRLDNAYMIAVASGAVAFWFIAALCSLTLRLGSAPWGSVGLAYSPPNSMVVIVVCAIFLSLWVIAAWIITLPPFLLVRWAARRFNIRGMPYYLCSGLMSGMLFCGLHEFIGWCLRAGELLPLADHMIGVISYGYGGALGAFVFWWIAVRPHKVGSV
jgi:hypothetical protein